MCFAYEEDREVAREHSREMNTLPLFVCKFEDSITYPLRNVLDHRPRLLIVRVNNKRNIPEIHRLAFAQGLHRPQNAVLRMTRNAIKRLRTGGMHHDCS